MLIENIRIALVGLQSNRLRAVLTMLGIIIGVWSVVLLLSVGQSFQTFVISNFNSLGTNLIFAIPLQDEDGVYEQFTTAVSDSISDPSRAPDVSQIMPQLDVRMSVVYDGENMDDVLVSGITPAYLEIQSRYVEYGRFFTEEEVETRARVAVVGLDIVDEFFQSAAEALGQYIRLGSVRFQIIGIMNDSEGGISGDNGVLFVPLSTAQTRLSGERNANGEYLISSLVMQARSSAASDAATAQVEAVLREERGVGIGKEDNFLVISQSSLLDVLNLVTGLLTVFLSVIAGISLVVGGIGVMNIMLVTVSERTREIGLRKAVGARSRDIVIQFLVEAIIICLTGGTIGVLLAIAVGFVITQLVADLNVVVSFTNILLAVTISVSIGLFFGSYPAQRAAKLNPIDALRYE